jgi:hypothetical protein
MQIIAADPQGAAALEQHARRFGYNDLRLETGERQVAATALYRSHGH